MFSRCKPMPNSRNFVVSFCDSTSVRTSFRRVRRSLAPQNMLRLCAPARRHAWPSLGASAAATAAPRAAPAPTISLCSLAPILCRRPQLGHPANRLAPAGAGNGVLTADLIASRRFMYLPPRAKPREWRDDMITNYRSNVIFSGLALVFVICSTFLIVWTFFANRMRGDDENRARKGPHVVIIGGGCGGSIAAAAITQLDSDVRVTVIDKKRLQTFTAMFPLAAAGHRSYDLRVKGPSSLFASTMWTVTREANLVIADVVSIDPIAKVVVDDKGVRHAYDALVIAAGAEQDHAIVGGYKSVDTDRVAVHSGGIRDFLLSTATGNVLMVRGPAKTPLHRSCEGTWVSTVNTAWKHLHWFGRTGHPDLSKVWAITPDATINDALPAAHRKQLEELWGERRITTRTNWELLRIDRATQTAIFLDKTTGKREELPYRFLAVDLPVTPPPVLARTPGLTDKNGFVTVDPASLRHTAYPDIFALGDCTDLPVCKAYGAISAQAPVLSHNVVQHLRRREANARYDLFSTFHINMSTWRVMWPEVTGNRGERCEPRKGYWDDSDWRGLKGVAQGVVYQMFLYELSYWFLAMRAHWCSPSFFSWPMFPPGDELGPTVASGRVPSSSASS
jgi:sulfide:quinone oxidoreductase